MLRAIGPTSAAQLTLEIVTFTVHEDVVDQDDAEDARPEMDVAEHQYESDILAQEKEVHSELWFGCLH